MIEHFGRRAAHVEESMCDVRTGYGLIDPKKLLADAS
jgi:hypothetical protein